MEFWVVLLILASSAIAIGIRNRPRGHQRELVAALDNFKIQREQLEARFLDLARSGGRPRGLKWKEIEWIGDEQFARESATGLLTAFVAVNIHFEAVAGGDMEDVEAVGTVRDATALFHYGRGSWGTGGRAMFNMDPESAVQRLTGQFESVDIPGTGDSDTEQVSFRAKN